MSSNNKLHNFTIILLYPEGKFAKALRKFVREIVFKLFVFNTRYSCLTKNISYKVSIYRVATAQGKQGIWFLLFPDRENTGNFAVTRGKYFRHTENIWSMIINTRIILLFVNFKSFSLALLGMNFNFSTVIEIYIN